MSWFINDPSRFIHEQDEIEKLKINNDWLSTSWRVVDYRLNVDFDIVIHGRVFSGRLTYPDCFPDTPAYIKPRNSDERWTGHQYGAGGTLCLEWRPDNWHTAVTGAELIQSTYKLLDSENKPENPIIVPSAHHLTEGQNLRAAYFRFLITSEVQEAFKEITQFGQIEALVSFSGDAFVTHISKVMDIDGSDLQAMKSLASSMTDKITPPGFTKQRGFLFSSDLFEEDGTIDSITGLKKKLSEAKISHTFIDMLDNRDKSSYSILIVLFNPVSNLFNVYDLKNDNSNAIITHTHVKSHNNFSRIPINIPDTPNFLIGIVGLGSVGSKVAVSLARSGFKNFYLLDDDILHPGNLTRNELDYRAVGHHKVDAVKQQMQLVSSDIVIKVAKNRLLGQESSLDTEYIVKSLSECNLIIDATANPEVFLILAGISKRKKIPLCWAEVFAGGYGGMIARSAPDTDPPPLKVRDALYSFLSEQPEAPFKSEHGYDVNSKEPLIAYDSDVGFIASALSRLAIDTISNNSKQHHESIYLLGMKKEWIFSGPFHTQPISTNYESWDHSTEQNNPETMKKALMEIVKIVQESK